MRVSHNYILNDEVFNIIMSTCLSATLDGLNDPQRFRQRSRTIGSNIYDMTPVPSGKISRGCIRAMKTGTQNVITKEHFHGRQEGGNQILRYVKRQLARRKDIDPKKVKALVDKHRQVHFTSAEENNKLGALGKEDRTLLKDWKKMYALCGIKLIPYIKGQRYDKYRLS